MRRALATELVDQLNAYDVAISDLKARWDQVQGIYNDDPECVVTSIDWPKFLKGHSGEGARPYNFALIQTRTDALVSAVAGSVCEASPMLINRGNPDPIEPEGAPPRFGLPGDTVRESVEQTLDYGLRIAQIERKARDACLEAILKGRGVLRVNYETILQEDVENWAESQATQEDDSEDPIDSELDPKVQYSGLVIDSYTLDMAMFYPSWCENPEECKTVGVMFYQSHQRIVSRQAKDEYFEDAVVVPGSSSATATEDVSRTEHAGIECWELYAKISLDDVTGAEGVTSEAVTDKQRKAVMYRIVLTRQDKEILDMEVWDNPRAPIFAPALKTEPQRIIPKRSIAAKAVEMQALMNDLMTTGVVGTINSAFASAVATGSVTEGDLELGLNQLVMLEGSAVQVTQLQTQFKSEHLSDLIATVERTTDAIFRLSAMGTGQQTKRQDTATAVEGMLAGQNQGLAEYTSNFSMEIEKLADYSRHLLAENYDDFKAFHGSNVDCQSEEELRAPARFEVFGRSESASPQVVLQKLRLLISTAQELQIPLDPVKVLEMMANVLNLNMSMEKLMVDAQEAQDAGQMGPQGGMNDGGGIANATNGAAQPGMESLLAGASPGTGLAGGGFGQA